MHELHEFCRKEKISTVKNMIARGANVNEKNDIGYTPLRIACLLGNYEIAKLLISNGANVHEKNNNSDNRSNTPRYVSSPESFLMAFRPCFYSIIDDGQTLLHDACYYKHYKIAELLISNGVNINEKNNIGHTPLSYACLYRHYEIAKLLVLHDVNLYVKDDDGMTPLMIAHKYEYHEMVNFIEKEIKKDIKKKIYILSLIINNDVIKHYIDKKIDLLFAK